MSSSGRHLAACDFGRVLVTGFFSTTYVLFANLCVFLESRQSPFANNSGNKIIEDNTRFTVTLTIIILIKRYLFERPKRKASENIEGRGENGAY